MDKTYILEWYKYNRKDPNMIIWFLYAFDSRRYFCLQFSVFNIDIAFLIYPSKIKTDKYTHTRTQFLKLWWFLSIFFFLSFDVAVDFQLGNSPLWTFFKINYNRNQTTKTKSPISRYFPRSFSRTSAKVVSIIPCSMKLSVFLNNQ